MRHCADLWLQYISCSFISRCSSLNAPPDLNVAFYDGTGTNKKLLAKLVINRCLQPGEYVDTGIVITDQSLKGEHTITVAADDDDGTGHGKVLEPDETDNQKTENPDAFEEIISCSQLICSLLGYVEAIALYKVKFG